MSVYEFDLVSGNTREIPREKQPEIPRNFAGENIPENPFDILDENADENRGVFLVSSMVIFTLIFGHLLTLIIGLGIALFATIIVWQLRQIQQQKKKYKFVAKLKSPVFITSRFSGDKTVYSRRMIAEALISSAWPNNKYMPVPPVYDLYRGDEGEDELEWLERKSLFKVEQTKVYHADIKKRNQGYYYRFILEQKDYPWQEEPQRD